MGSYRDMDVCCLSTSIGRWMDAGPAGPGLRRVLPIFFPCFGLACEKYHARGAVDRLPNEEILERCFPALAGDGGALLEVGAL